MNVHKKFESGQNAPHHKIVDGDQRILDPNQYGIIGQILHVLADYPTGGPTNSIGVNDDQNKIFVPTLQFSEIGATKVQRTLNTSRKLNAHNQYSPSIVTLMIEATVTKQGPDSNNSNTPKSTLLQGILKCGTGMANQGTQSGAKLDFGSTLVAPPIELDPRIIFDIAEGTMLSFPAAYFQLDLLYTSVAVDGFATKGSVLGPNYDVVWSLGYEPQGNSQPVTMTQLAPAQDLASGGIDSTMFFRPKYATHVYFLWTEWLAAHTLLVSFVNANGQVVWSVTYPGGPLELPPKAIPWPADAVALAVNQTSGSAYTFFKCVSVLEF
jgi:hypothetical protein